MRIKDLEARFEGLEQVNKEAKIVLAYALARDKYRKDSFSDEMGAVAIRPEIREAYFDLFMQVAEKTSIHQMLSRGLQFVENKQLNYTLDRATAIPFTAFAHNSSSVRLLFKPAEVSLEISDYSFNGGNEIREIGMFSTALDGDGNPQTNLRVGDTFRYHGGYTAHHLISDTIDRIQTSLVLPHIPRGVLHALPDYPREDGIDAA